MSPMVPMTERIENVPSVNVHQMMGPATPMTPMTPGTQDPAILPQLQSVDLQKMFFFRILTKIFIIPLQKYCLNRKFKLQIGS